VAIKKPIQFTGDWMTVVQIHTYCAMCVCRCGVVATVEDGVLKKVNADASHTNAGICVKGTAAPEVVYADRLKYPVRRTRAKGDADPGWARTLERSDRPQRGRTHHGHRTFQVMLGRVLRN
jgi:anaerobic selenocysteine-containing dehydrogenase